MDVAGPGQDAYTAPGRQTHERGGTRPSLSPPLTGTPQSERATEVQTESRPAPDPASEAGPAPGRASAPGSATARTGPTSAPVTSTWPEPASASEPETPPESSAAARTTRGDRPSRLAEEGSEDGAGTAIMAARAAEAAAAADAAAAEATAADEEAEAHSHNCEPQLNLTVSLRLTAREQLQSLQSNVRRTSTIPDDIIDPATSVHGHPSVHLVPAPMDPVHAATSV